MMNRVFVFSLNLQDRENWELLLNKPLRFAEIVENAYSAESSKHGLGLFAKRDLEQGTIVSFYPLHALAWQEQDGTPLQYVHPEVNQELWQEQASSYRLTIGQQIVQDLSGQQPYGDIELLRPDLKGWQAHRVNDAAVMNGTSKEAILEYYRSCTDECNSVLLPFGNAAPIMALLTTRAVKKDEELLSSYGYEYWVDAFGGEVDTSTAALGAEFALNITMDNLTGMLKNYANEVAYLEELLRRHYDSPQLWGHLFKRRAKSRARQQ